MTVDVLDPHLAPTSGAAFDLDDPRQLQHGGDPVQEIFVRAAGSIRGRVVGAAGVPVAGARVLLLQNRQFLSFDRKRVLPHERPSAFDLSNFRVAWTAADGRFELRGVLPGDDRVLEVAAAGNAPLRLEDVAVAAFATTDVGTLALTPGASILVRLRGASPGTPVHVALEAKGKRAAADERSLEVEGDGDHRIEHLGLVPHELTIDAPERVAMEIALPALAEGELRVVDVSLSAGVAVVGRVVDAADAPVEGATVGIGRTDGLRAVRTDSAGRFELLGLEPGTRTIVAEKPGYVPQSTQVQAPAMHVVLELRPAGSLSGFVLTQDGRPVEGARVSALSPQRIGDTSYGSKRSVVTTAADGAFRFDGLPAGGTTLEALARDGTRASLEPPPLAEGEARSGVELRLAPPLVVRGIVVDGSGAPIYGATVGLDDRAQRDVSEAMAAQWFGLADVGRGPRTTTAADGSFTLRAAADRTWRIRAHRAGFHASAWNSVRPDGGELRIVLEPAAVLRGIARVSGAPAANHYVVLMPPRERQGPPLRFTRTGEDGAYAFEDVPPGRYDLLLRDGEGAIQATREVEVLPGAGQVVDLP